MHQRLSVQPQQVFLPISLYRCAYRASVPFWPDNGPFCFLVGALSLYHVLSIHSCIIITIVPASSCTVLYRACLCDLASPQTSSCSDALALFTGSRTHNGTSKGGAIGNLPYQLDVYCSVSSLVYPFNPLLHSGRLASCISSASSFCQQRLRLQPVLSLAPRVSRYRKRLHPKIWSHQL